MTLQVYAVVGDEHPAAQAEPADDQLSAVRGDGLAAMVRARKDDVELGEHEALEHFDVLTALVADGAVVPVRFGTVAPDEEAVRAEVLAPAAGEFRDRLAATADVVELRLTLGFAEDAALRHIVRQDPELSELTERPRSSLNEQVALGEAVASRLGLAVAVWADELSQPVLTCARAASALEVSDYTTAQWALLVHRDAVSELDDEVAWLRDRVAELSVPCEVEYVGPLPPIDFPVDDLVAEQAAGTSRWGW